MDVNLKQSASLAGIPPRAWPTGAAAALAPAWFDLAPVGMLRLALDGCVLNANQAICKILDFPPDELSGKHFTRRMLSDDCAAIQAAIAQVIAAPGLSLQHAVRLIRRGGALIHVMLTSCCLADEHGQPAGLLWWLRDLEQGKQLKDMLQLSNRVLAASMNGVLITDASQPSLPIMYANPAFCAMTGYDLIDVMGRNCRFLQNDDREQEAISAMRSAIDAGQNVHVVLRNYRKDGSLFWNELFLSAVPDEAGEISHYIGILNDITAVKLGQEELAFQATHDDLTGLPNRELFDDRLRQAILQTGRHANTAALLCLELVNLGHLRASLGQAAGEQLLRDAASRLLGCVRGNDTVSRHGGAEFTLILGDLGGAADASAVCEDILRRMAAPFDIQGVPVYAQCSAGLALCPLDSNDAATLLRYAGLALARARQDGDSQYQFFAAEMNQHTMQRVGMETALRLAIGREQLHLMYQPLVDLHSGEVSGLEALLRWQHPVQGWLPARAFIPLAEESGLIGAIGDWVLRRACHDLRDWAAAGLDGIGVAINLSPRQLRDRNLDSKVAAALRDYGLPADALTLEVGEAALGNDAGAACLARLKVLGVRLALDDFGTGLSSLSSLKRHPFDLVKIDQSFISNIVTDTDHAGLSKTIIAMAHHLGIKVVAEGVETEAQCNFLRRHQCDQIQGYFFAPPMGPYEIAALLREKRRLPPSLHHVQKQKRTLLLVDDEQNILAALKRLLRRDDYRILTACGGQEGLDLLACNEIDVIVSDQRMPGMIGADFLRKAKLLYPDTIRIMLSGYTELQSVTDAVNEGAIYKFLTKPWEDDLLRGHIAEAFRLKEISDDNERLNCEVRSANHELASANRKLEQVLVEKQQQISRDEISLQITRELLQWLPLAVIGLDDEGYIAFINGAAEKLFQGSGALLGNEASQVLPALFPSGAGVRDGANSHLTEIGGHCYCVVVSPMGASSASRGSLITLNRHQASP